jgi:hypothetical protein
MYTDFFIVDAPEIGEILAARRDDGHYYYLAVKPIENKQYEPVWFRYDFPMHFNAATFQKRNWTSTITTEAAAVAIILQCKRLRSGTSGNKP